MSRKKMLLEGIKYVLLLMLIISIILIKDSKMEILIFENLIIFTFYILYIIINIKEMQEKKLNTKYKVFIIISLIFLVILINQKYNVFLKIAIFNCYILLVDILKNIVKNTKLKTLYMYLKEYLYLLKNNLVCNNHKKVEEKNILILISSLNNGGAERVAGNLANNLNNIYNNVMVLTYNPSKDSDYKCDVPRLEINNKRILIIKEIRKIKEKYNITHCISFCTTANYLNITSNDGEKKIISIRNYEKNKDIRREIESKIAAKYADKVVSVSEQISEQQISDYKVDKGKAVVINNFCEVEKIREASNCENMTSNEKEFFEKYKIVISVGRLTYQKGQWYMIRAFKEVLKEIPAARLVILGEGEEREKLQNLIKQLNMQKYIKLYGFKKNPYQYLKHAKLFVMTSLYEGMSNAILEAMCCGLPIVSSDCLTGVKDILAPNMDKNKQINKYQLCEYGVLVPVGDGNYYTNEELTSMEIELKNGIIKMMKDNDLYRHYNEMSKIRIKDFEKEKIMKQWINLIEEE